MFKFRKKKNSIDKSKLTPQQRRALRTDRIVRRMWKVYGILAGAIFLFFILTYNGIIGYMPPVEELKNPQDQFASMLYSADGEEMGRFYDATGNRVYADLDEISQHVVDALVATEDVRFEEHSGIDYKAVARAIIKTGLGGDKSAGGGSTLTQQLAKQLYSPPTTNFFQRLTQKPTEWMIAIQLERFYSKEEIVKMYLNQFDFLYNAVGIKSAAQVYFHKDSRDLDLHEAALLVGMVKNPSIYNPVRQPERALSRRNTVLDQMYKAGKLTRAQLDSVKSLPLDLDFHRVDRKQTLAPYFRDEVRRRLTAKKPVRENYPTWGEAQYLADVWAWENDPSFGWIEKNPKSDGSKYNLYTDGLRIYTTLDSRMQRYAEEAVAEHMTQLQHAFEAEINGTANKPYTTNISAGDRARLVRSAMLQSERGRMARKRGLTVEQIEAEFKVPVKTTLFSLNGMKDTIISPLDSMLYIKKFLRTGMVALDPTNGYVKAYVGGINYDNFQYDMVSIGRRQVGSVIKPLLYAMVMDDDGTPCDRYLNAPHNYNGWIPRSSSGGRRGQNVDLRWALTTSNNWISARLIDKYGPQNFVNFLHNMGITGKIPAVPSICLGSPEISLMEMVAAYTPFANQGMKANPMMITAIADNKGNIIAQFAPQVEERLTKEGAAKMLYMLKNVVNNGTAKRMRSAPYNIHAEMGGKTGTTNSNSDAWFIGFTPDLVVGSWVGGEERFIHFNATSVGQGAAASLPIYGIFMNKLYSDAHLGYSQDAEFVTMEENFCGSSDGGGSYRPRKSSGGGAKSHASSSSQSAPTPAAPAAQTTEVTIENVFD